MGYFYITQTDVEYRLGSKYIKEANDLAGTTGLDFARNVAMSLGRNYEFHTKLKNACRGEILNVTLQGIVKIYFKKIEEKEVKFIGLRKIQEQVQEMVGVN
jgi:hypothetical protein